MTLVTPHRLEREKHWLCLTRQVWLILSGPAIFVAGFAMAMNCANAQDTIQYGRYQLHVTQQTVDGGRLGKPYIVSCEEEDPVEVESRKYQKLWSATRTSTLEKIAGEAVIETDLPIWMLNIKSSIKALVESQTESESGFSEDLTVDITQKKVVEPIQCFYQSVEIKLTKTISRISGTRVVEGIIFDSKDEIKIEISESQPQINVKLYYNESCNYSKCGLDQSLARAVGTVSNSLGKLPAVLSASDQDLEHLWTFGPCLSG